MPMPRPPRRCRRCCGQTTARRPVWQTVRRAAAPPRLRQPRLLPPGAPGPRCLLSLLSLIGSAAQRCLTGWKGLAGTGVPRGPAALHCRRRRHRSCCRPAQRRRPRPALEPLRCTGCLHGRRRRPRRPGSGCRHAQRHRCSGCLQASEAGGRLGGRQAVARRQFDWLGSRQLGSREQLQCAGEARGWGRVKTEQSKLPGQAWVPCLVGCGQAPSACLRARWHRCTCSRRRDGRCRLGCRCRARCPLARAGCCLGCLMQGRWVRRPCEVDRRGSRARGGSDISLVRAPAARKAHTQHTKRGAQVSAQVTAAGSKLGMHRPAVHKQAGSLTCSAQTCPHSPHRQPPAMGQA